MIDLVADYTIVVRITAVTRWLRYRTPHFPVTDYDLRCRCYYPTCYYTFTFAFGRYPVDFTRSHCTATDFPGRTTGWILPDDSWTLVTFGCCGYGLFTVMRF